MNGRALVVTIATTTVQLGMNRPRSENASTAREGSGEAVNIAQPDNGCKLLHGGYIGDYIGEYYRVTERDARSF